MSILYLMRLQVTISDRENQTTYNLQALQFSSKPHVRIIHAVDVIKDKEFITDEGVYLDKVLL